MWSSHSKFLRWKIYFGLCWKFGWYSSQVRWRFCMHSYWQHWLFSLSNNWCVDMLISFFFRIALFHLVTLGCAPLCPTLAMPLNLTPSLEINPFLLTGQSLDLKLSEVPAWVVTAAGKLASTLSSALFWFLFGWDKSSVTDQLTILLEVDGIKKHKDNCWDMTWINSVTLKTNTWQRKVLMMLVPWPHMATGSTA